MLSLVGPAYHLLSCAIGRSSGRPGYFELRSETALSFASSTSLSASPLYCIDNQHDFEERGENQRMLHDLR